MFAEAAGVEDGSGAGIEVDGIPITGLNSLDSENIQATSIVGGLLDPGDHTVTVNEGCTAISFRGETLFICPGDTTYNVPG